MRINILQHTPSEGPGSIQTWADNNGHEAYIYHPAQFGKLPSADQTDMLVILGGPMSPNDDFLWIKQERELIKELLKEDKPMYGACFGAQQIAKCLGANITKAAHKEVGWAEVAKIGDTLVDFPEKAMALHWHEEMFELPQGAELIFSSKLHQNQGFIYGKHVMGLQFHFEPLTRDVRTMVINDGDYTLDHNDLKQSPQEIMDHGVPSENAGLMAKLLDQITK
ncbi:class I glutamine amidotransferase [Lactobacillus pasteurii DSM 23907 = CRBIP 24.76]|uniref:Glutamine amidotransferase n=1 Tax=Lactobacillus pasteurii DSM 23907 = CRBIP 24.76 TaxID=1423790 RepID=I7IZ26_9LACO|nr:type 1 glutamine amidotransferase [Lactobacillus pasteurii]KRK08189.1 class I glutamine amidotransferase [Lactobacillus pasteurii DSM 23907 = CRBIP 24.76]TDG77306.1 hypothetical protein C5L33_000749 [Lactobacillus pasteurii]CCI84852.1 Glutamine amidotransferase [Lactobacillus pasteurii DSM 23907 = CRBIP 24.76]